MGAMGSMGHPPIAYNTKPPGQQVPQLKTRQDNTTRHDTTTTLHITSPIPPYLITFIHEYPLFIPTLLSQQQMQQQHAISYVTTIRNRFANEPDTYRSFLKILHTYQKVRNVSITSAKYCHTRSIPPQPLTHGSLVFTLPMYDNPHANIILNVLNIILISLALILLPSY